MSFLWKLGWNPWIIMMVTLRWGTPVGVTSYICDMTIVLKRGLKEAPLRPWQVKPSRLGHTLPSSHPHSAFPLCPPCSGGGGGGGGDTCSLVLASALALATHSLAEAQQAPPPNTEISATSWFYPLILVEVVYGFISLDLKLRTWRSLEDKVS